MDWLEEIREFPGFDGSAFDQGPADKDLPKAAAKYDKAVKNALNDSPDIAVIELRKLAVLYPEAGQINALLGCCQALSGRYGEAIRSFEKARLRELPFELSAKIDRYIKEASKSAGAAREQPPKRERDVRRPAPEIIRARTSDWKKSKVASRREKREIIEKMNTPRNADTFVSGGIDFNWVRAGMIAVLVLLIGGIAALGIYFYPKIAGSIRSESAAADKLEWLLGELDGMKGSNSGIEEVLRKYEAEFYPPAGTSGQSGDSGSAVSAPVTPSPSPTTAPTIDEIIIEANGKIMQAQTAGKSDPKKVMQLIRDVREMLDGIGESTTAADLTVNVGDILTAANNLEKSVVNAACYTYYRDGKSRMDAKDYAGAAAAFKNAYDINPDYLDGGITYNLGKAYAALGETELANACFQYVVDTFPGTDYAGWAAYRIKPVVTDGE